MEVQHVCIRVESSKFIAIFNTIYNSGTEKQLVNYLSCQYTLIRCIFKENK